MKFNEDTDIPLGGILIGILVLLGFGSAWLFGWPQYKVYEARLSGQAKLAESQASRQVLVSEAQAKKEAAVLLGEAALTQAEYQAKAAKTLDSGLSPSYLQFMWINAQAEAKNDTVVYIPTNTLGIPDMNLPITEANRLNIKGGENTK